jgi:hypothetical protein
MVGLCTGVLCGVYLMYGAGCFFVATCIMVFTITGGLARQLTTWREFTIAVCAAVAESPTAKPQQQHHHQQQQQHEQHYDVEAQSALRNASSVVAEEDIGALASCDDDSDNGHEDT